jgi:hypothetical protein
VSDEALEEGFEATSEAELSVSVGTLCVLSVVSVPQADSKQKLKERKVQRIVLAVLFIKIAPF